MPTDLNDYFTAFRTEAVGMAQPDALRTASERRVRRRTAMVASGAAIATVAVLGAAVGLATPAATPLPPAATPSPSPSPSPALHRPLDGDPCENADLKHDDAGGHAITGGGVIAHSLTNVSSRVCSLTGFVSIRHFDGQGQPETVTSEHDGTSRSATLWTGVQLRPGEVAYFPVTYFGGSRECPVPYNGRTEFSLPGQDAPFLVVSARECPDPTERVGFFTKTRDPSWHPVVVDGTLPSPAR